MPPLLKYKVTAEVLNDFVATMDAKPNLTKGEVFQKFPELKNDDGFLSTLSDWRATIKSGKYKTEEEVISKFPELELVGYRKPIPFAPEAEPPVEIPMGIPLASGPDKSLGVLPDTNLNPFITAGKKLLSVTGNQMLPSISLGLQVALNQGLKGFEWAADQTVGRIPGMDALNAMGPQFSLAELQKKYGLQDAQALYDDRQKADQVLTGNLVNTWKQVNDPATLLNWGVGSIVQLAPQIFGAIATGGASAVGQEVGSIYGDSVNRIAKEKGITPQQVIDQNLDEPMIAVIFGSIAGALEYVGAKGVAGKLNTEFLKKVMNSPIVKKLRLKAIGKVSGSTAGEMSTEGAQTVVEHAGAVVRTTEGLAKNIAAVGEELKKPETVEDIKESMRQGGVGGSAVRSASIASGAERKIVAPSNDLGKFSLNVLVPDQNNHGQQQTPKTRVTHANPEKLASPIETEAVEAMAFDSKGTPVVVQKQLIDTGLVDEKTGETAYIERTIGLAGGVAPEFSFNGVQLEADNVQEATAEVLSESALDRKVVYPVTGGILIQKVATNTDGTIDYASGLNDSNTKAPVIIKETPNAEGPQFSAYEGGVIGNSAQEVAQKVLEIGTPKVTAAQGQRATQALADQGVSAKTLEHIYKNIFGYSQEQAKHLAMTLMGKIDNVIKNTKSITTPTDLEKSQGSKRKPIEITPEQAFTEMAMSELRKQSANAKTALDVIKGFGKPTTPPPDTGTPPPPDAGTPPPAGGKPGKLGITSIKQSITQVEDVPTAKTIGGKAIDNPQLRKYPKAEKKDKYGVTYAQLQDFIDDMGWNNSAYKEIFDFLKDKNVKVQFKFAKTNKEKKARGTYSSSTNTITVYNTTPLRTLGHEAIHAMLYTSRAWNNKAFVDGLRSIRNNALEQLKTPGFAEKHMKGFSQSEIDRYIEYTTKTGSLQELVTHAFTHPGYANFLSNVPASREAKPGDSAWSRLKKVVLDYIQEVTKLDSNAMDELNALLDEYAGINVKTKATLGPINAEGKQPPKQEPPKQEAPKKKAPVKKEAPKKEAPIKKEAPKKEAPVKKEAPKKEAPVVKVKLTDVKAIAKAIGFNINAANFKDISEKITGKRHLDEMTQPELVKLMKMLTSFKEQSDAKKQTPDAVQERKTKTIPVVTATKGGEKVGQKVRNTKKPADAGKQEKVIVSDEDMSIGEDIANEKDEGVRRRGKAAFRAKTGFNWDTERWRMTPAQNAYWTSAERGIKEVGVAPKTEAVAKTVASVPGAETASEAPVKPTFAGKWRKNYSSYTTKDLSDMLKGMVRETGPKADEVRAQMKEEIRLRRENKTAKIMESKREAREGVRGDDTKEQPAMKPASERKKSEEMRKVAPVPIVKIEIPPARKPADQPSSDTASTAELVVELMKQQFEFLPKSMPKKELIDFIASADEEGRPLGPKAYPIMDQMERLGYIKSRGNKVDILFDPEVGDIEPNYRQSSKEDLKNAKAAALTASKTSVQAQANKDMIDEVRTYIESLPEGIKNDATALYAAVAKAFGVPVDAGKGLVKLVRNLPVTQFSLIKEVSDFVDAWASGRREFLSALGKGFGMQIERMNSIKPSDFINPLNYIRAVMAVISAGIGVIQAGVKMIGGDIDSKYFAPRAQKFANWTADVMKSGVVSQNALIRNASLIMQGFYRGLAYTSTELRSQSRLRGQRQEGALLAQQWMAELYSVIGRNQESLARIHSVLDPEGYANTQYAGMTYEGLNDAEKGVYAALRVNMDNLHNWSSHMGYIDDLTFSKFINDKNEINYFGRAYQQFYDEQAKGEDVVNTANSLRLDFNIYKKRKEFSEIDGLDLEQDPIYIAAQRMATALQNQAVTEYSNSINKNNKIPRYQNHKAYVAAGSPKGFAQLGKHSFDQNTAKGVYGDLSGMYLPNYIVYDFKGFFLSNDLLNSGYTGLKKYDRLWLRRKMKEVLTVYNPAVVIGNQTSNYTFAFVNGIDTFNFNKGLRVAEEAIKEKGDLYKAILSEGLIGTGIVNELQKQLPVRLEEAKKQQEKDNKSAWRGIKKLANRGEQYYAEIDDKAKIAAYWVKTEVYGMSHDQAIAEIGQGFQNYATVGMYYDIGSKMPIIGNAFAKFTGDLMRIVGTSLTHRPLATASYLGFIYALNEISSALSDEDETEKEIRQKRPFQPKVPFIGMPLGIKVGDHEINLARLLSPFTTYDKGQGDLGIWSLTEFLPIRALVLSSGGKPAYLKFDDPLLGWFFSILADTDFRGKPIADPDKILGPDWFNKHKMYNRAAYAVRALGWFPSTMQDISSITTTGTDVFGRKKSVTARLVSNIIRVEEFGTAQARDAVMKEINARLGEIDRSERQVNEMSWRVRVALEKIAEKDITDQQKAYLYDKTINEFMYALGDMGPKIQKAADGLYDPITYLKALQEAEATSPSRP